MNQRGKKRKKKKRPSSSKKRLSPNRLSPERQRRPHPQYFVVSQQFEVLPLEDNEDEPLRRSRTRLRQVKPGALVLITKKTCDDFCLIRPDGKVEWVLLYLLLHRLKRYGLELHAFIFLSNHFHLVVTDVKGNLPAFMRDFLSESSKAVQIALGVKRTIWSSKRYASTELLDRSTAERYIAYCQTNPTEAGLTLPRDWPGLTSARTQFGGFLEARRPEFYCREHRAEVIKVPLSPLPTMLGESAKDTQDRAVLSNSPEDSTEAKQAANRLCRRLQSAIDSRVEKRVEEILEKRKRNKQGELAGSSAVLKTSRWKRGNPPDRGITPRFAGSDADVREYASAEYKAFCSEHRDAVERYVAGETNVLFPHGTWGYRELLRVRVRKGGEAA